MIWQAILVAAAVIFVAIIAHALIVAPTVPNEPPAPAEPDSPRPLVVDTATGSHDHIPMRDDIRHMVTDYCEAMWHHTTNGDVK